MYCGDVASLLSGLVPPSLWPEVPQQLGKGGPVRLQWRSWAPAQLHVTFSNLITFSLGETRG